MLFAVIKTGGKQYKVHEGAKIQIEKLVGEANAPLSFADVLLVSRDGAVSVGKPHVSGAKVEAIVVRQFRDDKKIVFKYHSKTRRRKKKGHRQELTEVLIQKITA